jgi:hypothetical protein
MHLPRIPAISAGGAGRRRAWIGLTIATGLAVLIALAGCGGGSAPPRPSGPLAEALADLDGGGANGSLGVGWAEPRLVEKGGAGAGLVAAALGPNAGSVIQAAPELRRRFAFDPLSAERLISVGGSYAFGLRLDGVDGRQLGRALTRGSARTGQAGPLELARIGGYAEVPGPLLNAGVTGLGARDAFGPDLTVLAISGRARASLLGRGDRLIEEPIYRAAAHCLGDVIAARMVPDNLLLSTDLGVNLVAVGIQGNRREVLCVVGGSAERASQATTALKASLAPGAREPRTGESMGDLVSKFDVATVPYEGVEVVRAELRLAAGQPPGFLFGAISRGSLAEMIGGS